MDNNIVLASLPEDERKALVARMERVDLPQRKELYSAGETPAFAYFIETGIASVVATSRSGEVIEVGVTGREGIVGAVHLLDGPLLTDCFMQVEGSALRLPLPEFRRVFNDNGIVRAAILKYVHDQITVISQLTLCQRLHGVEQRLSRWLLMLGDRIQAEEMRVTQEFLAEMLGTQRTTVTMVAGELQRSGLIEYSRGRLRILDRAALEKTACECYQVISSVFPQLREDVEPVHKAETNSLHR